jgi:hypothetical protein
VTAAASVPQPQPVGPAPGLTDTAVSGGRRVPTRRNIELALIGFGLLLLLAYSAAMEAAQDDKISGEFWVPVVALGLIFVGAHVVVRLLAPHADPVLLPAVCLLNGIGVMFLRRLDLASAAANHRAVPSPFGGGGGRQLIWTLGAVVIAMVVLAIVRDHRSMSQYAFTMGLGGLILVLIPALLPARFSEINNAKLWIKLGPVTIQPGEFAKILLLVFFAYYLVRKRDVLRQAVSKKVLGLTLTFPRGRDLGPVITVWLLSLMVLVVQKDLGT